MQIRLGNRQDEGEIKHLVAAVLTEFGHQGDTASAELDLRNIDGNYMGRDGIFLVAEEEGRLLGLAGARRRDEETLELRHLVVAPAHRGKGIASRMLAIVAKFAGDLEYKTVAMPADRRLSGAGVLEGKGFILTASGEAQLAVRSARAR